MSEEQQQANEGFAAQLMQLAPWVKRVTDALKPLFDQPVIRFPFVMPLATSQVIAANASAVPLTAADFQFNLEYPFEVHALKFSQDASHTFRDWRVRVEDQTFNQNIQKNNWLVADVVDDNTGKWKLEPYPWTIRPKGGGFVFSVDNQDALNAITVDLALIGYLLIPR